MDTTENILAGMESASEIDLNAEEQDLQSNSLQMMFSKSGPKQELMMGSTIRDLVNTIKEAKNFLKSRRAGELELEIELEDEDAAGLVLDSQRLQEEGDDPLQQMSACLENAEEEDHLTTNREENDLDDEHMISQQQQEEEDDEVIDIDNPEQLAAKGLRRIQIDGEDEEYLMDLEGNIYDLQGNFIGTTDTNGQEMEQQEDEEEEIVSAQNNQ